MLDQLEQHGPDRRNWRSNRARPPIPVALRYSMCATLPQRLT